MRKRSKYKKNEVIADYVFKRGDVSRFINYLMEDGRKSVAEKIFYSALENIKNITKEDGLQIFEKAMTNASPLLEVVSKRVG